MIQFHKSKYSVDMVIEKLQLHQENIDIRKLDDYLGKMSASTIKIFGILYDFLGVDSSRLYELIKDKRGTDWMFAETKHLMQSGDSIMTNTLINISPWKKVYDYPPTTRDY